MMAKPLKATYSPIHPYIVSRQDWDDGSISYEVWDIRPDSYRRLCSLTEHEDSLDYDEESGKPKHTVKTDAELIARALNLVNAGQFSSGAS